MSNSVKLSLLIVLLLAVGMAWYARSFTIGRQYVNKLRRHPAFIDSANYHSSRPLFLNRIFFELEECNFDNSTITDTIANSNSNSNSVDSKSLLVRLPPDDFRAKHITNILKLQPNDLMRCGVVDVGLTDRAKIVEIVSDRSESIVIDLGTKDALLPTVRPLVDLILAIPRPLRLERVLPVISCLGVRKLSLIAAAKVEKDYFGTHLLRRPKELRQLLVEGIAQAEVDANIPEVSVIKDYLRQLKKGTVDDDSEYVLKLIAHPPLEAPIHSDGSEHLLSKNRLNDLLRQLPSNTSKKGKVLLAIGPEGGWTDEEVRLFISKGYHCITFGNRILRTDMAIPVALGIIHEWLETRIES